MHYPDFFDQIPSVVVCDPLAGFLGAASDGIIEYKYLDAVKFSGHSCPTVASAYWMTLLALKAIYGDERPIRGGLNVKFSTNRDEGVAGVMAGVVQLLTGAAGSDGFKGMSGIFYRCGLMSFGVSGIGQIRFIQRESLKHVDVSVDLSKIQMQRDLAILMHQCLSGEATQADNRLFGELWQQRVKKLILHHGDDPEVFKVVQGRR